jgi:hypothetical protein
MAVQSSDATGEHILPITNLAPNTRYYYNVGTAGGVSSVGTNSQSFITAPTPGSETPTRIWILGDSGTGDANAAKVRDAFKDYSTANGDSQFLIMLGDNAYNSGTDNEYQAAVFDTYPEILMKTPVWSTLGNHDGYSADSTTQTGPYYDIFSLPRNGEAGGVASGTEAYYSFDYGNIHFVCLNSYDIDRSTSGAMLQWLAADLEVNNKEWLIAFFHHPPYTKGSHDSDYENRLIEMRENALPLLESAGVDLVLSGHSHSYERSFLIDGHYGLSNTLTDAMKKDDGDGDPNGDGSYAKRSGLMGGNVGAVYAVPGSSGKISGGALNHPAMKVSLNLLGSMILEIDGETLDAIFLDEFGTEQDNFRITHTSDSTLPLIESVSVINLAKVEITFSEQVRENIAEDKSNYSILPGINVLAAKLGPDKRTVTLTTSALGEGNLYVLSAENIKDISGNIIAPGSVYVFTYSDGSSIELQNGVLPTSAYTGTKDTFISEANPTTNYGSNTSIEIDGDDPPSSGQDLTGLLRWDLSVVPNGTIVTAASISLNITNGSSNSYSFYQMLRDWDENQASWNQAQSAVNWGSPGANDASDRSSTILANIPSASTGAITINLNAEGVSVINAWLDNPSSNFGLILGNTNSTDGLDFSSSEEANSSLRPRLSLSYQTDINPPQQVTGLISTTQTKSSVSLAWNPAIDNVGINSYAVFRNSKLIAVTADTFIVDTDLESDTSYQYYIIAIDLGANISTRSNTLQAKTLNGDSDNDGVNDDQELLDGTDPNDAGSFISRLGELSCTEWNGFFSMFNYLELLNQTDTTLNLSLELYGADGVLRNSTALSIPANGQWDQPVHEMAGFMDDEYGLICARHNGGLGALTGQMVIYRFKDTAFEFAMSLPLANGVRGAQIVSVNTFNPEAFTENVVANWIQIANLGDSTQSGELTLYAQDGSAIAGGSFSLSLGSKSRVDIPAHQFGMNYIGSARWAPSSTNAAFSMRSIRYIYDNPSWLPSLRTAAPVTGRAGSGRKQYVPYSTVDKIAVLEVINTQDSPISISIEAFSEEGDSLESASISLTLNPRESYHFLINEKLGDNRRGQLGIQTDSASSIIASSLHYQLKSASELELMYLLPSREPLGKRALSSFNTFVEHRNTFIVASSLNAAQTPALTLRDASGNALVLSSDFDIPARGNKYVDINSLVSPSLYGRIEVVAPSVGFAGWTLRERIGEYILPFEAAPQ